MAEAYLADCQLEKSLGLWREILAAQPDNGRAKLVVDRLTAQALDLDTQLATIARLIDKGVFSGTEALLDAAGERAATNAQKAEILYLRGRLSLRDAETPPSPSKSGDGGRSEAAARSAFAGAMAMAPDSVWSAKAAIATA